MLFINIFKNEINVFKYFKNILRAYLDTHFGDESVASNAESDKLILGIILDDP